MPVSSALAELRQQFARNDSSDRAAGDDRVSLGLPALDRQLGGGLLRGALHEVYAPGAASLPAAMVFGLGLACRAAGERPILWVRQEVLDSEIGRPYPPGLAELGLDPSRFLFVRVRDAAAVLRASAEAARCPAIGAVVMEPWGEPRLFDLTASRRLVLTAEASGVITLLLRAVRPEASAARSRWLVGPHPSRAREANAPGDPAFHLRLLRHRGGHGEGEWCVEWDRDRRCFQQGTEPPATIRPETPSDVAPLSRPVVAFPANGPIERAQPAAARRRAG